MAHYHIWDIGCQMNKADSERLAASLEALGHRPSPTLEGADIIVVNSCVVRQSAEERVANRLSSLKPLKQARPELVIALTGCMVDSNTQPLHRRFPHVDLFLRPQEFTELLERVGGTGLKLEPPIPYPTPPAVFVPVIHGCDNFCSYCIVPFRRGRERSRPLAEVVCEVEGLVRRGAREVTLLGQNVNAYGHDLSGHPTLAQLLAALNGIEGLARIRLLTSHPRDITPEFIQGVARLDKVCEHLSLPVQAGDDVILAAMKRGYSADWYRQLIAAIRQAIPGVALSTDVIVGFSGETEEQFGRTLALLEEIRFDVVHVAAYSPRPGTAASRLPDDVPPQVKKERLQRVEALEAGIAAEVNAALEGRTVEVLVEGRKGGKWEGRTRTNKLVFFPDPAERLGQLVMVRIEKASPWALQGLLSP